MGGDASLKREIADNLNQNKACSLGHLLGDMTPQEQYAILKEATKLANTISGRDKFSAHMNAGQEGLWWGSFVTVSVQRNLPLGLSPDIFTTQHKLEEKKSKTSCTENYW